MLGSLLALGLATSAPAQGSGPSPEAGPATAQPLAAAGPADPSPAREAPARPNVIVLIADDLRPELGVYGSAVARTPVLDRLAASGVRFDRAYTQFPLCSPSRTSMLTGLYPSTLGIDDNSTHFRADHPDLVTYPQYFQSHGYVAVALGKITHSGLEDPVSWTRGLSPDRPRPADAPPLPAAAVGAADDAQGPGAEGASEAPSIAASRAAAAATVEPPDALHGAQPLPSVGAAAAASGAAASTSPTPPSAGPPQRTSDWAIHDGPDAALTDYARGTQAVAWLRKLAKRPEPFLLAVGFERPHAPLVAPRRFFDAIELAAVPLPVDFAPLPTVAPGVPRQALWPTNGDLFRGVAATPQAAREAIRAYAASVAWIDEQIGRVLAEVRALGIEQRTIVVVTSDHGYHLGEKGKWSKHGSLYEVALRVPLLVSAPGRVPAGVVTERPVELVDLYPTLAALAGLPAPSRVEGHSLVPLIEDPTRAWPHAAYSFAAQTQSSWPMTVRTDRHRFTRWDVGGAELELYDERSDPHERVNVARDPAYADVRRELFALTQRRLPTR